MAKTISIPIPPEEKERLQSILGYEILDTTNDEQLDELTHFTANIFNVPIALITIIDHNRQWFKSNYGLSIKETARTISFCQYTIMGDDIFEVENAPEDERFADNPLVIHEPNIRFYCGVALTNEQGYRMGSLAIIDRVPRKLDQYQKNTLKLLAQQVVNFFELNMKRKELEKEKKYLEERVAQRTAELEQKVRELKQKDEKLISVNNELNRLIYKASHDLLGPLKTLEGLTYLALHESDTDNIRNYLKLLNSTEQKLDTTLVNLIKLVSIKDASDLAVINWNLVIGKSLTNAKKRAHNKAVHLHTDMAITRAFVSDPSLLEMIIEELLVNSMQYNLLETVSVKIKIYEENENVAIDISDNGIGIADQREELFEMFYRGLNSKGSGLGLYIAKKAIEKLAGQIFFESSQSTGTTFRLLLPYPTHLASVN